MVHVFIASFFLYREPLNECLRIQGVTKFRESFQMPFLALSLLPVKTGASMKTIQMVDLASQTQRIRGEIDAAISSVISNTAFINGPEVANFAESLKSYLGAEYVIPCANGTDALQIALMALELPEGSEVISAGFSYAALAEVCALLKLKLVFVDADPDTFNINALEIEKHIGPNTRVIVPVHLFGQCSDMETIMAIAEKHNLFVVEDNAQSIGADYTFSDGRVQKSGTIGQIGTTSFFPSKNLGCFGDGGALFTNSGKLAEKIKMIANHGQKKKYHHEIIGVNSRLDTLQAAILGVKIKYLDAYIAERRAVADQYDAAFSGLEGVLIPKRLNKSTHVFHQYTLQLPGMDIASVRTALAAAGIPSMVYYPLPLYRQEAYKQNIHLPVTEMLCSSVLSLPMGTDMDAAQIETIIFELTQIIKKQ